MRLEPAGPLVMHAALSLKVIHGREGSEEDNNKRPPDEEIADNKLSDNRQELDLPEAASSRFEAYSQAISGFLY